MSVTAEIMIMSTGVSNLSNDTWFAETYLNGKTLLNLIYKIMLIFSAPRLIKREIRFGGGLVADSSKQVNTVKRKKNNNVFNQHGTIKYR